MPLEMPKNINISLPPQMQTSRNSLFEVVLLVVACGLFSWFLIFPKKAQVAIKEANLEKYKTEQSKMASNLDNLDRLIKQLKNSSQEVKKLDDALPLNGKTINLRLLMEKLAADSGVVLGDVSVAGKSGDVVAGNTQLLQAPFAVDRTLQKLVGSVFVIGNFTQLEAFLKKVEGTGRIIQVTSAEISSAQSNALSLQLGIEAYYFAP